VVGASSRAANDHHERDDGRGAHRDDDDGVYLLVRFVKWAARG
jgi:hypothetical protein